MPISINGLGSNLPLPPVAQRATPNDTIVGSFQNVLGDVVGNLNKLQSEADSSAAKLAAGEPVELHEVLLATERATLGFQLAVQVRNKVVEAYQDIMRMQV
ncbi:MAG: flagellar hook-basal body complex protein FliE [Chloroflexi bacterium]|nr:flagellar hook-basal body complex protein FliE [Chloroflexota bacterium]